MLTITHQLNKGKINIALLFQLLINDLTFNIIKRIKLVISEFRVPLFVGSGLKDCQLYF
jgi:hypothetical protein